MNRVVFRRAFVWLGVSALLAASLSVYAGGQLYRYLNDKGVLVIDGTVPPKFTRKGYDVISPDGTLIRRVPRQLTKSELLLRNTDESRLRFQEEEQQRLREWDQSLMLRYSSIDDIKAAEGRAMQDFQIRISILKSNLATIKSRIERAQQKAADIERQGTDVPELMINNMSIMRIEIEDTEQSIAIRREEVEMMKASYVRDIERFATLQDRVEMRQQIRRPRSSVQGD